jgi:4a-hydroxytetrahydrobiopterin dehydratase
MDFMKRPPVLTSDEVQKQLSLMDGWSLVKEGILKEFSFSSYLQGLEFVRQVGDIAEKLNHHPQMVLNFQSVTLTSKTHDPMGITDLDFQIAKEIDSLFVKSRAI